MQGKAKFTQVHHMVIPAYEGVNSYDYVVLHRLQSGDWHLLINYKDHPDLSHVSQHESWTDAVRTAEKKTLWENVS